MVKLVLGLNGNLRKEQIASAWSWGLVLGLIPAGNVFWVILFILSFFFRHHHRTKIFLMVILKLLSFIIAPLVDLVGWEILHIESLQPLYTSLYNMPFVPFTNFNNTLVAGGMVIGIVLWLPVYFLVLRLIPLYRERKTIKPIKKTKGDREN